MKKKNILIFVILLITIIIVSQKLIKKNKIFTNLNIIPKVYFDVVEISNSKKDLSFPATISVSREISVISEVSGKISAINVNSGAEVRKGQIILDINDQIYKVSLNKHQALFKYNQLQFERLSKLNEKGVISKKIHDEALSKYESSKSSLAAAEYDFNNTKIKAPSDGIISLENINIGEYIEKGKKVFSLFNFNQLVASFYVSQTTINEIELGQKVRLSIPNFGKLTGNISFISPNFEKDTNSIKIEAKIENPEKKRIVSNSFAEATIKIPVKDAILISEDAIIFQRDKIYVFAIKDNKVYKKQIEVGPKYKDHIVVTKGLEEAEKIVVRGQTNLKDGQEVENQKFVREK